MPPTLNTLVPKFPFKSMPQADRVKRAQELMRQAGYGPNNRLKATYDIRSSAPDALRDPAAIQAMWREIYVDADLRQNDTAVFYAKVQQGDTRTVTQPAQAATGSAEIIDLTELLQRSLKPGNRRPAARPAAQEGGTAPRQTARKRAAAKTPSAQRKKAA